MKILFVSSGFLPEKVGAMELHMQFAARELIRRGHDVLLFCRTYRPGQEEFALEDGEYDGIPLKRLNYKFSDCLSFEKIYSNNRIRDTFDEVFREYGPDLVHVHHLASLSADIVNLVEKAGVPVVMSLHDYWLGCPRTQRITASLETCSEVVPDRCVRCLRRLWPGFFSGGKEDVPKAKADEIDRILLENYHETVRSTLNAADRLITPSLFVKKIYERFGIDKRRMSVVRNGVDRSLASGVVRKRSPVFKFGFLGPVIPPKGVHILIEAFQRIAGSDSALHIWGEVLSFHKDTNYGHRLAILSKGWETSIHFHGRYDNREVVDVLSEIDVLVVPSIWYESSPMVVREAFLAGTPVIASNFGALAEAVDNGTTGVYFNVGDSVDLSEKMKNLKDDIVLRQRLEESPKNIVSVEENVDALLEIYRHVVDRGGEPTE
jgi:glycosyltransferase involved in cell wall biosynthesis